MKKSILMLAFLFSTAFLLAQGQIAKKIQHLEAQKVEFKKLLVLNQSNSIRSAGADSVVNNATFATINPAVITDITDHHYNYLQIEVPYNGTSIKVDLYKVNLFTDGFHVDTDKSPDIAYEKGVYYRGIINGDYQSVASFNFFNNELNGIVSNNSLANLVIGKLNRQGNETDYIIYADKDLNVANDFGCSATNDAGKPMDLSTHTTNNKEILEDKCTTIYFEIDNNIYTMNSSNTAKTTNWITSVFNNVQTLYDNDGIKIALKSIYIWTTPDPYEGISFTADGYLYKFEEVRPTFDGDLGQLVGMDPGMLGGIAYINTLCDVPNRSFSYSDVSFYYKTVPKYSPGIRSIAHEFGHLFGSKHTHECVWNNNNTAIDGCDNVVGACAQAPMPPLGIGGTIMSYCHISGAPGINFNNGFGPQPKQVIVNAINAANCLGTGCITCISKIADVNINAIGNTSATITWVDANPNNTNWQIAVYPFDSPFTLPSVWINVTQTPSYTATNLLPNTYYKVHVRVNCDPANGLTSGEYEVVFATGDNYCDGITFYDTGGEDLNYEFPETFVRTLIPDLPNNKIKLTFSEFSLEPGYDFMFIYDGNSIAAPSFNANGYSGNTIPGPFTSTANDGALTLKFISNYREPEAGWKAATSCEQTLGINELNRIDFSYYPNPTNGEVKITSATPIKQIAVYNIIGQVLYENNNLNNVGTKVDMSRFVTGTYFFKLKFKDREVNFKVLKE